MTAKYILLLGTLLLVWQKKVSAQNTRYIYNPRIDVKQGSALAKLKNPFVGGFETPQFSTIDLDLDGTKDLLVFDRGTKMYYTFLNDKIMNMVSYTYAPQYIAKLPVCQNFCLTYDYNNDGKMDLYVEANGYIQQFRNTSLATLSFAPPDTFFDYNGINVYCPSTNIPSFNDIDNDGDMDILSWDPTGFTINLYKNWREEKNLPKNEWKYKIADECWGKFYLTYSLNLGYHCPGMAYYPNGDDYTPPPITGSEAHSGSTLLTLDMDSDGDYEALLGDIFYNYLYYIKNGKNEYGYAKDSMVAKDSLFPSVNQRMQVDYFPAAYFLDVDNDGKRDIIMAPNDASGASKNKDQVFFYKNIGTDRKPVFDLIQKNFLQETSIDIGGNTAPAFTDIDNDGDDDLFIASRGEFTRTLNAKDFISFYRNTGTLLNPVFELQDTNFLNLSSKNYSGLKPCFGDLNGDGKKDLLLGDANGKLKYYINTSAGGNITFIENTTQFASFSSKNYSAPYLVDYNRDGKLDLFLGNYDGTIVYYQNTGSTSSPVFTKTIDSVGKICLRLVDEYRTFYGDGMSVPVIADLDHDGKYDLLTGGKNGLYLYYNIEGKLNDSLTLIDTVVRFSASQLPLTKVSGRYISPAVAQLDSDSVYLDLMIGNNGGGVALFCTYEYKNKVDGLRDHLKLPTILSIRPNPASTLITIEGFEHEMYSLLVYDATGKLMTCTNRPSSTKPVIDISALQQGVYFVVLRSENGTSYNGKFLKL